MNIILFDQPSFRNQLKPITLTRPIGNVRVGTLTIDEKWQKYLNADISFLTEGYLSKKYSTTYAEQNIYINASCLPNEHFANAISKLCENEALMSNGILLALITSQKLTFGEISLSKTNTMEYKESEITIISELPHLFLNNGSQISADFKKITLGRKSAPIEDKYTAVYNEDYIFIEEGASIKASILNAENGPIYIGRNAVIQEGSLIIGPASIGENAMVAFGAKIRPNTTLGPVSRVGGEVGNSIFHGYSNKAHDGFLGNSYIGEWCNLGANTNNSNLKNDYKTVKLYNYDIKALYDTHETFCGTFMGDYSKAGISTMFNTGTVVGVSSNIFGSDFQEKFIDSFSWGGKSEGYQAYRFEKAIEVINATMARREKSLSSDEIEILSYISQNK
ncbi:putative sugar nucleotidyl transferase [Lacihabitans soyangensis]|uniref:Glucose-1-phosphate thymidylyltransferase n=1 Tax=Lacihabitans soyangensis TaxID=869394 RepID=A0AAE3H443_9BACT|nr:putative sugar nucleotidyl transferase [Lacihabitans soyangensis]MCP9764612.1 glucose-1-phosphate thymidylyltransferase [Lacihabitans soyangensis]